LTEAEANNVDAVRAHGTNNPNCPMESILTYNVYLQAIEIRFSRSRAMVVVLGLPRVAAPQAAALAGYS
jgi:hypothetical protein